MKNGYPDKEWLRERVVEEIFYKPANLLLPMFIGLPLAIGPWMLGQGNALITFGGVVTCLVSAGAYASQVALRWGDEEQLRQKILQRATQEAEAATHAKLEALRETLVRDGDSRSERLFDQLIALQQTLKAEADSGLTGLDQAEIFARVEELIEASLQNLQESANLVTRAAEAPSSTVQGHILNQREDLLAETQQSIEALDRILLTFLANQKDEKQSETVRIRRELESQLEISERVKKQLASWENPDAAIPATFDNPETQP